MKRALFLSLALSLLFSVVAFGQLERVVQWKTSVRPISDTQVELRSVGYVGDDWHIYSKDLPDGGPIPTSFTYSSSSEYTLDGPSQEIGQAVVKHDPIFDMDLTMYSDSVVYVQAIKRLTAAAFTVSASVEYQTCKDGSCNFEESDLTFQVPSADARLSLAQAEQPSKPQEVVEEPVATESIVSAAPAAKESSKKQESSLLWFFFAAFAAGLVGLMTPCVFPMIPMTVTFFLGKKNRANALLNAFLFGFSIIAIYTLLGVLISLTSMGAEFITDITTHWITNTIFFLLFIVFAASFFGMFEIRLPSSISNKTDSKVDKGGYVGTFFFALTTVIVSLSCVGPLVGSLLIEAVSGSSLKPALGMFAFALGFSLPFTLFAIFPSWLNKLPKSGGWLNSVKIILGFIVLAMSLKFLLGIDVALNLQMITRPIFISIWIVLACFLGLYLLGYLRFKYDSPISHVGFIRMLLAASAFTFAVYLFPGLFGAPLSGLSGFFPAPAPDDFNASGGGGGAVIAAPASANLCETPKYADFIHMPPGVEGYRDYKQALSCAKQLNKPIFIEFSGHGCANCKEMAAKVLSKPQIANMLNANFVNVALYVDDRYELPEAEWYTSDLDGKVKKTIGRQNMDLQRKKFNVSGQPLFFIVAPNGEILMGPLGRELDVEKFQAFLQEGLNKFRAMQQ